MREYDAHGDRRTGTAVDRVSAEWSAEQVRDASAEPFLEPFALDRVDLVVCFLDIDGRRLDGLSAFDGGFTAARRHDTPQRLVELRQRARRAGGISRCSARRDQFVITRRIAGRNGLISYRSRASRQRRQRPLSAWPSSERNEPPH
ncbi:MAG: hypothetical protein ACR2JW_17395 [Thermomicrobiales bacterium]